MELKNRLIQSPDIHKNRNFKPPKKIGRLKNRNLKRTDTIGRHKNRIFKSNQKSVDTIGRSNQYRRSIKIGPYAHYWQLVFLSQSSYVSPVELADGRGGKPGPL